MGLQSYIMNRSRIFLMYCSCEKDTNFFNRSLEIITPRIYASSPISFISNLDDNHPFTFKMYSLLFIAISMSSTYKDKITNLSFEL